MKAFTMNEMENIFEIGRVMQAMFDKDEIEIDDSKDAFYFALKLAMEFEEKCPNSECYYLDLDEFVTEKIMKEFGTDN
jgi:hypothetical protein